MQRATLKIISIFLCGLLIYNSLGYFLVLSVMRISVRHQKWAHISNIPDQQLTTFKSKKNEVNSGLKHVNKREIMVNGKLYDIARKIDDGKSITYYCVHDKKEEKLIAKTRQFNSMAQPVPVKNTARLIIEKIIKTAVFEHRTEKYYTAYSRFFSYYSTLTYSGPVLSILLPPPQSCC